MQKQALESQTSHEKIRQLVENEGKTARNLVTWSVPAVDASTTTITSCSSADTSTVGTASSNQTKRDESYRGKGQRRGGGGGGRGRERNDSPLPAGAGDGRGDRFGGFVLTERNVRRHQAASKSGSGNSKGGTPAVEAPLTSNSSPSSDLALSEEMCKAAAAGHYGNRQPRVIKSPGRKVKDLHARYWSYLFDNLHRAVDEIYNTCETDESIVECQEVIMTLDICRRDFVELIKRFELFERSDLQSSSSKLAWEVRKTTSPSKIRSQAPPPPPYSRSHPRPPSLAKQQSPLTSPLRRPQASKPTSGTNTTPTSNNKNGNDASSKTTPNSARALDFSGSGKRQGRKVWPSERTGASANTHTISSLPSVSSKEQATPTWADRVRGGVSRVRFSPSTNSKAIPRNSSSSNNSGMATNKVQSSSGNYRKFAENLSIENKDSSGVSTGTPVNKDVLNVQRSDKKVTVSEESQSNDQEATVKGKSRHQSGGTADAEEEEEEEEGGKWETVCNSRSQPRIVASAVTATLKEDITSYPIDGVQSSGVTRPMSGTTDSPLQSQSSDSGGFSPGHDVISLSESSFSPESQSEVSGRPSDEYFVNVSIDSGGIITENLTIEDLAGSATAQLVLDAQEEEEEEREKMEEECDTGSISVGHYLSQSSDKDAGWSDIVAEYEAGASYRSDMSWADRCESPPDDITEVLPEVPRSPGRAIHLHQRLSSPSRKRPVEDVEESRRLQEEKQAKAQLQRCRIQEEKAQRSKMVANKIRGVKENRDALTRLRKEALEDKLQRAVKMRESHLQEIVRKAQEEEAKVSEISFINTLEAQNKKIEVLERYQGRVARLQELQEERQRKREEQLAKEEAAQERRRVIEAERQAKLMELQEKRREQDAKLEQKRQEKEKAREEAARERERKLEARNAAIQSSVVELEKKILLKHNESSRRYDQQLEQKKKATVASRHTSTDDAPRVEAYKKKKWCTICNVRIISDVYLLSHLRGRKHTDMLSSLSPSSEAGSDSVEPVIIEASEEHQGPPCEQPEVLDRVKAGKKRAKKLRHRIASRTRELEGQSTPGQQQVASPATQTKNRVKLQKALRDFNKHVDRLSSSSHLGGVWDSSLLNLIDRSLGEMKRTLSSGGTSDQLCFCLLGGLASVLKMLLLCSDVPSPSNGSQSGCGQGRGRRPLPEKTFLLCVGVLELSCSGHVANCRHLLLSSKVTALIDLSHALLTEALPPKEPPQGGGAAVGGAYGSNATPLCGPLLSVLASMISTLAFGPLREDSSLLPALLDVISYMVGVGLVDRLGDHFNTVVGPIGESSLTQLVLGGLNLLVATTACMHTRVTNLFAEKRGEDPTLLTVVLRQTELVGLMQLLYAILLHDGPPRHSASPPPLTNSTLSIATATIKTVNNFAIIDLKKMQACLGAEGISLEFRHIVSYLLWYCSYFEKPALLHELILAIGYFCVLNHDNQVFLQSGRSPTLLQLLCGLPFQYFTNKEHSQLLYPTLISVCYQVETNRELLKQEMSCKLLVAFLERNIGESTQSGLASKSLVKSQEGATTKDEQTQKAVDHGSLFEHRFPMSHWKNSICFFST